MTNTETRGGSRSCTPPGRPTTRSPMPIVTAPALATFLMVLLEVLVPRALALASPHQDFRPPARPPSADYVFEVDLDLESRTIKASGTISFTNSTDRPINTVALAWSRRPGRSLEVRAAGQTLEPWEAPEEPIVLSLTHPLMPTERIELEIDSTINGYIKPEEEPFVAFAGTAFPRLWWGERANLGSYSVKITHSPGYALAATGRLDESTGFYEAESIDRFGIYLGQGMKIAAREVAGVRVAALYSELGETAARICLEAAVDAVPFYKEWLGVYPHDFLFLVPWGHGVWGGFSWAPGVVAIHGEEAFEPEEHTEHFKWITAHEIGHQYWGEHVLDPDDPPWLWIGLGIYADREYSATRLGSTWKHERYIDRYLEGVARSYDMTLEITPSREELLDFDRNSYAVHAKGFAVIQALEAVLGRETFQALYRRCLHHFAHRSLGLRDFWRFCEEQTGEDLDWFFEQWTRSDRYLHYEVSAQECVRDGAGYRSRITISRRGDMSMPLPVLATFEDGSTASGVVNRLAKHTTLEMRSASRLVRVELDPEGLFAMLSEPLPLTEELLEKRARRLSRWSPDLDEALEVYAGATSLGIESEDVWYTLGIILARHHPLQAQDCWQRHARLADEPADQLHASAWLGLIEDSLGNRAAALEHYHRALASYDGSQTWPHNQYGFRVSHAWVGQRLSEPFRWQDE